MNKLDYSISLREKGFGSNEIKKRLKEEGLEESQIQYYLKKSDEIFLNQLIHNKKSKSSGKTKKGIKIIVLVLNLLLLFSVFFDYARIGLLGLFVMWSLIGYSSFRK
ncbi:hypothetical protein [Flavivirga jejuensis]|uniref:Uncharacterized protein n=1 Tax=Flavivirga jejuensis TaxID=870487 RepID=A0ABT8WJD7_9FLAO|nr:hypothetical protein [Flavivirga jejuensis]MDO5973277.1 hypothetical protein [Flavivirga jejuensis]